MRFRSLLPLCLLPLLGLPSCQRSRAVEPAKAVPVRADGVLELHLMSFNVRYETPDDRDLHAWRERVVGATRMIRRIQPDCIGVQEAQHGQVADLWASLPDYEFFGVGRDDGRRAGEYSGIYYRKDRFRADPADGGTFWLSDTPETAGSMTWGNGFPRVVVWTRLLDLATGRGFYVFNTHWDHKNQPSRERAALLTAARIDARRHPDEPVAMIGDFNSNETNPGLIYLTGKPVDVAGAPRRWANGLLDTYQARHPGEPNRRSLHFWHGNLDGPVKVDHILVSRGAEIEASAIVTEDRPVVSDHFPVTARVRFPLGK
ncbi:endonuclease/exonuclease/phosphatase family protein [bacterium]|nr:endonuclease/exonuclease/phosphatase family protein [bacterium]